MITRQTTISDLPHILYRPERDHQFPIGQCDCARTVEIASPEPSAPFLNTSYVLHDPFLSVPLTSYGYYAMIGKASGCTVLNRSALELVTYFKEPHSLENVPELWRERWNENILTSALIQMIKLGLLVPKSNAAPKIHAHSATLSAWLHITECCNLRCSYCYLPHTGNAMSIETGCAAIDATFRSALIHGYRKIQFKYAGGEPLLRFDRIAAVHQYAEALSHQHRVSLAGVVLSNGTLLTADMVNQMQSLGLRLMISLDGLGDGHNCHRSYTDGYGSFEAVSKAIDRAVSYGLIPDISITVSGRNIEGLPELVEWLLLRDLPFSLNFYREHDRSSSDSDLHLEEKKIIEGMLKTYKVIEANLPQRSLLTSLADCANFTAPHLRTCNVGQSYLVFDSQGRVAKCQMDIDDTITDIHDPDPLSRVCENLEGIQSVSVEEKQECSDCQWRYWCAGGCPLLTHRVTGSYNLKSPNCTMYKTLYPEVIRLEGLRVLHYSS